MLRIEGKASLITLRLALDTWLGLDRCINGVHHTFKKDLMAQWQCVTRHNVPPNTVLQCNKIFLDDLRLLLRRWSIRISTGWLAIKQITNIQSFFLISERAKAGERWNYWEILMKLVCSLLRWGLKSASSQERRFPHAVVANPWCSHLSSDVRSLTGRAPLQLSSPALISFPPCWVTTMNIVDLHPHFSQGNLLHFCLLCGFHCVILDMFEAHLRISIPN